MNSSDMIAYLDMNQVASGFHVTRGPSLPAQRGLEAYRNRQPPPSRSALILSPPPFASCEILFFRGYILIGLRLPS